MTEALIQTGNKIFILLLSMFLVSCGPTSSQPDDLNSSIAIEARDDHRRKTWAARRYDRHI